MSKCNFINTCSHASGWCNSASVVMKCEWFNERYEESLKELYGIDKEDYLEGKMEQKFKCGYCGKWFDAPAARAKCELKCEWKRVAEEERQLKEKLAKEKQDRLDEITAKRKDLVDLERRYYKDYGVFAYTLREPLTKTVRFNGDWGKFFNDCFDRVGY